MYFAIRLSTNVFAIGLRLPPNNVLPCTSAALIELRPLPVRILGGSPGLLAPLSPPACKTLAPATSLAIRSFVNASVRITRTVDLVRFLYARVIFLRCDLYVRFAVRLIRFAVFLTDLTAFLRVRFTDRLTALAFLVAALTVLARSFWYAVFLRGICRDSPCSSSHVCCNPCISPGWYVFPADCLPCNFLQPQRCVIDSLLRPLPDLRQQSVLT